jgi:hypothetical protein
MSAPRGRRVIADSPRILVGEDRAAYVAADAERPR